MVRNDSIRLTVYVAALCVAFSVPTVAAGMSAAGTGPVEGSSSIDAGPAGDAPTEVDPAAQDDPETADEYLTAFRRIADREAFEQYNEFETIRSFAVSKLQVAPFSGELDREMEHVLAVLESFDRSYAAAQDGEHERSLQEAAVVREHVDALLEAGYTYAPLADLALNRFYEDRGDELLTLSEETATTPDRIERLELAAEAFQAADASRKYSEVSFRLEELRTEYERDVEAMDAAAEQADDLLDDCACSAPEEAVQSAGIGVFDRYAEATATVDQVREGHDLATKHALSSRTAEFETLRTDVESARETLTIASVLVLVGYGAVVALVAMLFTHRFVTWRRTFDASQVGEIVMMEGTS